MNKYSVESEESKSCTEYIRRRQPMSLEKVVPDPEKVSSGDSAQRPAPHSTTRLRHTNFPDPFAYLRHQLPTPSHPTHQHTQPLPSNQPLTEDNNSTMTHTLSATHNRCLSNSQTITLPSAKLPLLNPCHVLLPNRPSARS